MANFDGIVRLYLAATGVESVKLRAGAADIMTADLSGILPYIAWQTLLCAKVMSGTEPLSGKFLASRSHLSVIAPQGIHLADSRGAMKALAWVFMGAEEGNLIPLEDEVTALLRRFSGELPVQEEVNAALINGYLELLAGIELNRSPTPVVATSPGVYQ